MIHKKRRHFSQVALSLSVAMLSLPGSAFAQPTPAAPTPAAPTPAAPQTTPGSTPEEAASPKMAEAKERFSRALKLYQDANYEAARVEFERAYELAPSWRLLYNIGYCYRQLNDYVSSIRAFERFLSEGGTEIAADRQTEVTTTLVDLRARIAFIEVNVFDERASRTTPVIGATVSIDDVPIGVSPFKEPIRVNPGRRKISASEKGGAQVTQIVTVAGRETARVNLELSGPRTIIVEKKGTNYAPYIAWGATGVFAIGTAITGVLALGAATDQDDQAAKLGTNPAAQRASLEDARSKTQTLGAVTDVLLVTTIVAAGVATYFTIKAMGSEKKEGRSTSPRLSGSGFLSGTF